MAFYTKYLFSDNNSRATSPAERKERMLKIQSKLDLIHTQKARSLKEQLSDVITKRVLEMEKRCSEETKLFEVQIRDFKANLHEANNKSSEICKRCQLSMRTRTNQIADLKRKVASMLVYEAKQRNDTENRLMKCFQDKIHVLCSELQNLITNRIRYFNQFEESLSTSLPEANYDILAEIKQGQQTMQQLQNAIAEEMDRLKGDAIVQQKCRQDSLKKIMEMIGKTMQQIQEEMASQRIMREGNRENIMALFENACKKLQI